MQCNFRQQHPEISMPQWQAHVDACPICQAELAQAGPLESKLVQTSKSVPRETLHQQMDVADILVNKVELDQEQSIATASNGPVVLGDNSGSQRPTGAAKVVFTDSKIKQKGSMFLVGSRVTVSPDAIRALQGGNKAPEPGQPQPPTAAKARSVVDVAPDIPAAPAAPRQEKKPRRWKLWTFLLLPVVVAVSLAGWYFWPVTYSEPKLLLVGMTDNPSLEPYVEEFRLFLQAKLGFPIVKQMAPLPPIVNTGQSGSGKSASMVALARNMAGVMRQLQEVQAILVFKLSQVDQCVLSIEMGSAGGEMLFSTYHKGKTWEKVQKALQLYLPMLQFRMENAWQEHNNKVK